MQNLHHGQTVENRSFEAVRDECRRREHTLVIMARIKTEWAMLEREPRHALAQNASAAPHTLMHSSEAPARRPLQMLRRQSSVGSQRSAR